MALSVHVKWGRSILNARAQPRRESYNLKSAPGLVERFIKWKPAQKELGLASCWPIHFILSSAVGTLESSPSGRFPMISPWTPPLPLHQFSLRAKSQSICVYNPTNDKLPLRLCGGTSAQEDNGIPQTAGISLFVVNKIL